MKKFLAFGVTALLQLHSFAQHSFTGIWEGKINAGAEMTVIFTIKQDEFQKYTATMDVPGQGIKGIVSKEVVVSNDSIRINIKEFGGFYAGKQTDNATIHGEWKQGMAIALLLKKVEKVEAVLRPQTPVPPFSYKTEDVIYHNKEKTIQYGATITTPHGPGPFPAVILITGSGQQNRDEEMLGHKPFAVIADHLTKNGFVVLRADDRGMGQTTGDPSTATTLDFSDDINTGIEYLKGRKEVNVKRIALLGHSEGGMIAQILGSKRKDIAAIVMLGAPGKSGAEVLTEQNREIFMLSGMSKEYADSYIELYASMLERSKNQSGKDSVRARVTAVVENWLKKTPANIAMATTGISGEDSKGEFINNFTEVLALPWFQYFIGFQPDQYIVDITCPVLALNGSRDIQVLSRSNLSAIEAALKKSRSPGYLIKEYEGLNHLFQKCKVCTIQEYGALDETISAEVLKDIGSWLTARLRND